MQVRDESTGEVYETTDAPIDTPNPDITTEDIEAGRAPEFLVECVNPMGETVTMSVVEGTQVIAVEGGIQVLPPLDAPNQFVPVEEEQPNG